MNKLIIKLDHKVGMFRIIYIYIYIYDRYLVVVVSLLRFWLCQLTSTKYKEIGMEIHKSSEVKMIPHLYKCPAGYNFDVEIRFCQPKEIASCGVRTTTISTTPKNRDIGLLELLLGTT